MYDRSYLEKEARKCSGCGTCMRFCPIFKEAGKETISPRGKALLISSYMEGDLPLSNYLQQIFSQCLLCHGCKDLCPPGLEVNRLVLGMRAEIAEKKGLPLEKRLVFDRLLKNRSSFHKALTTLSGMKRWASGNRASVLRHLPLFPSALKKGLLLPPIAPVPLRDMYPEVISPEGRAPKMKVGFFSGCYTDFVNPAIGQASIKILHTHGCEIILPRAQTCCGMPVFASGDWATALDLAEINRKSFEGTRVDAVITACATCGTALKHLYQEIADSLDPQRRDALQNFSRNVFDISEFLIDRLAFKRPKRGIESKITYHDPCHLLRTQKVVSQPREILGSIFNAEIAEMPETEQCCGGGGAFSIDHPELSEKIGIRKVDRIEESGAELVATGCPGCLFQIGSLLSKREVPIKALHTVEVLADLYT